MRTTTSRLARLPILAAIIFAVSTTASAGSDPFEAAVKHIEQQYHARQTHVPLMGLANFVLKFWHPAGVKNIRLAVFQNQNLTSGTAGPDFDKKFRSAAGAEWQPIVQVYSREKGERTYIYHSDPGKDMKILVVNLSAKDAVVAQVKFEPEKLAEFMQNPRLLGMSLARDIRQGPGNSGADSAGSATASQSWNGWRSGASDSPAAEAQPNPGTPKVSPVLHKASSGEPEAESPSGPAASAAQPKPETGTIRLEGRLVNLNVKATDKGGKVMPGLGKDDFQLFEDGVRQDITFFEPNTSPVNLLLLLDLSGSTKDKMKVMRKAARKFIDSLNPSDRIAVAAFTRRFFVISDFTSDHQLLKHRIDDIKNR